MAVHLSLLYKTFSFPVVCKRNFGKNNKKFKKDKLIFFFFFFWGGEVNYKKFIFKKSPLDANTVLRLLHRAVFISLYNYRSSHNF